MMTRGESAPDGPARASSAAEMGPDADRIANAVDKHLAMEKVTAGAVAGEVVTDATPPAKGKGGRKVKAVKGGGKKKAKAAG